LIFLKELEGNSGSVSDSSFREKCLRSKSIKDQSSLLFLSFWWEKFLALKKFIRAFRNIIRLGICGKFCDLREINSKEGILF